MISRREMLLQSLTAAAGVGLGVSSLPIFAAQPTVCTLTCQMTLGPCYYSGTSVRSNITEGKAGLPTLLSFLVVNADTCQPIPNASIDIWHTDAQGIYSAPINIFCNPNDAVARTQTFCRGVQLTAPDGWAHFNSIYPGWYSGRTTHIHATIRMNGNTSTDCPASDGTGYDLWQFSGKAGDTITIDMRSAAFDTYMILLDPSDVPVAENDDVSAGSTDSHIAFTLTSTGTWTIVANGVATVSTGDYTLSMSCPGSAPSTRRRAAGH